jgi:hypothetical protein
VRRLLVLVARIVGAVAPFFAARWLLKLSKPSDDLRPARNALIDARYYWRRRVYLWSQLRVRLTYELGIADANLRAMRYAIANGAYDDDTAPAIG